MKTILAALVALMLVSGTAWAQTGPDYFTATNTGTVGTKVLLNTLFRVNPTPRFQVYALSADDAFKVSGYRYMAGTWTKVFPLFSTAPADTAVSWGSGMTLPITQQVDLLCVTSDASGGSVKLVWYK